MRSGAKLTIGMACGSPTTPAPQPSWKTAVSTPYAAATESRFITAALIGMTTDRNARRRTKMLRSTTTAIISGSLSAIFSARSM